MADLSGPIDTTAMDFLRRTIEEAARDGSQAVVVQLDSPAALTNDVASLLELVEEPPIPVVVWVGPAPAVAYGGAAQLLAAAQVSTAAPGTRVGYLLPTVAGQRQEDRPGERFPPIPEAAVEGVIAVEGPVPGLVDEAIPTLGQVILALDGREVVLDGEARVLHTVEEVEDGRLRPAVPVRFHKPGLAARLLRLALRPEAAFFFLVAGLSVAIFEFYALGPGVAAGLALSSLLLAAYGLAVLPLNWWSVAAALAAMVLLASDFQRGRMGVGSGLALAALLLAGLSFTDAGPQMVAAWWAVVLTVLLVAAFFMVGMPAVVRARFSTPTIGRDHLVGRGGKALSDLAPEGVVEVGEGRWQAVSHRQAGIRLGDRVVVSGVRGLVLRVDPASRQSDG